MLAEVTYNAGASYTVGKYTFLRGKTQEIRDASVITRLEQMTGFSVRRLERSRAIVATSPAPKPVETTRIKRRKRRPA